MCIIVAKEKGVNMPEMNILKTCFENNPDGAGVMWNENNKVEIRKGFMKWSEFESYINRLASRISLTETGVVMHFRITTHGGTNPKNCHPFPISSRIKDVRKLRLSTDVGVAHNGIIHIGCISKLSDTQTYVVRNLSKYKAIQPDFYKNQCALRHIANEIKSKMCFLNASGEIYTIGDFNTDNGVLYSNSSYINYFGFSPYYNCFNLEHGKYLTPIEGFIIDSNGEIRESDGYEYYIDSSSKVYQLDFGCERAFELDGARAYTFSGMPFHYNAEAVLFVDLI